MKAKYVLLLVTIVPIVLFVILIFVVSFTGKQQFQVDGPSMEPTLHSGEYVTADKSRPIKTNDIIVFEYNDKIYIKRIIKMKDNCFWVEGDNKENSEDSRELGWICQPDIKYYGVVEK
jgi:signal peptidase I